MLLFRMRVRGSVGWSGCGALHCIGTLPDVCRRDAAASSFRAWCIVGLSRLSGAASILVCLSDSFVRVPMAGFSSGFLLALFTLTRVKILSPASNTLIFGGSHSHIIGSTCTAPCLNCIDCLLREIREACKGTELAINQSPPKRPNCHKSRRPNASHTQLLALPFMIRRKRAASWGRPPTVIRRTHRALL